MATLPADFTESDTKHLKNVVGSLLRLLLLMLLQQGVLYPQSVEPGHLNEGLPEAVVERIINSELVDLEAHLDSTTLHLSGRLGIRYTGIEQKFLVQFDVDETVKETIRSGERSYSLHTEPLEDGFVRVQLEILDQSFTQSFYFHHDRLIPRTAYFIRSWTHRHSRFFDFYVSNLNNFNQRSVTELDEFVSVLLDSLQVPMERRQLLEREKIIYLICNSQEEIEQLTGFNTRGIYLLAFDQIVSQFNAHFHEVAHLLINFKLQELPLYVHPFVQEGFASAVGGRGDRAARVTLSLGKFLQQSEFLSYQSLFRTRMFLEESASLSYPASAIYNRFLLDLWGFEEYLTYYRRHCSPIAPPAQLHLRPLPSDSLFQVYLQQQDTIEAISFGNRPAIAKPVKNAHWGKIWQDENLYYFEIRGSIRMTPPDSPKGFDSKEFHEIFPDVAYQGEQYLIEVNEGEVKLFNFYNAKLEAIYAHGLSLTQSAIRADDGMYRFAIRKSVFDSEVVYMAIAQ